MDTYSFLDCQVSLAFPTGAMTITGAGVGEMTVAMDQERSVMEPAAGDARPGMTKGNISFSANDWADSEPAKTPARQMKRLRIFINPAG